MRVAALDLSKTSTGWAVYAPGDAKAASGAWPLGSEYTSDGRVYCNLHERLTDLHRLGPINALFYEEALNPGALHGHTNIDTLRLLSGLCAHAQSWGEAMGCRVVRAVNLATWRRHFLGKMPRATKTVDLKAMAIERCRQLGFAPRRHDEAEAIGLLTFALDALGTPAPWERGEVLRAPLAVFQ